jgi:hypothetical protein
MTAGVCFSQTSVFERQAPSTSSQAKSRACASRNQILGNCHIHELRENPVSLARKPLIAGNTSHLGWYLVTQNERKKAPRAGASVGCCAAIRSAHFDLNIQTGFFPRVRSKGVSSRSMLWPLNHPPPLYRQFAGVCTANTRRLPLRQGGNLDAPLSATAAPARSIPHGGQDITVERVTSHRQVGTGSHIASARRATEIPRWCRAPVAARSPSPERGRRTHCASARGREVGAWPGLTKIQRPTIKALHLAGS